MANTRFKLTDNLTASVTKKISIFGPPPISENEDAEAYGELFKRVTDLIQPRTIADEFLVQDYVAAIWDRLRLRRGKANLLSRMFSADQEYRTFDAVSKDKFPIGFEIYERATHLDMLLQRRSAEILRQLEYQRCELSEILGPRDLPAIGHDKSAKD